MTWIIWVWNSKKIYFLQVWNVGLQALTGFAYIIDIWDKIQLNSKAPEISFFILSHTSRDFDTPTTKNYEEKTTKKGLDLKFNMFCTFKTMKDLNLALYMNLGDSDASKTGEKSSHTSRGMGV